MLSRRPSTRTPARVKKTLEDVEQGVSVIYPLSNQDSVTVDIVAVPGLGAHPVDSWKGKEGFNFLTSKDGLKKEFPKSRIMLYKYNSAWQGPLKVKANLREIASTLLKGLRELRVKCPKRPIVFIGHSMGGLVIAKAVTISDQRPELYPKIFPSVAGCIFFGTPFDGAHAAAVAAMYAEIREFFDGSTAPKLLEMMRPGNETVKELRSELLRLAFKLSTKIELFCFYEMHQTDFLKIAHLPGLFDLFKTAVPKKLTDFVSEESAVIPGLDDEAKMGLQANHSDLVKFESFKDERYALVRSSLRNIINKASMTAKTRFASFRDVDRGLVNGILEILEGVNVSKKRRTLQQSFSPSLWLPAETEYQDWKSQNHDDANPTASEPGRGSGALWIRGREGRGKTNATLAALDELESIIYEQEISDSGGESPLLAYFFCDTTEESSTGENMLKSLIYQLIKKDECLATHAKTFNRKGKGERDSVGSNRRQPSLTVDNLWQVFQDMLSDNDVGGTVYIVVNNLHALSRGLDSTDKLLRLIHIELETMKSERPRVKWLLTSRNEMIDIDKALKVDGMRLIDLEDPKYEGQVQVELRKHASSKVDELSKNKQYSKALAYFTSSFLGKRAQNTQWIDLTCVSLEELPIKEKDMRVRSILEAAPQDLGKLLDRTWWNIFRKGGPNGEQVKEMLRSLILTYEDPSEEELGVIAGLSDTEDGKTVMHQIIKECQPLLTIKRSSKGDTRVAFINLTVKTHLRDNAYTLLGLNDEITKLQQGIVAWRCFEHILLTLQKHGDETEKSIGKETESNIERVPTETCHTANEQGGNEFQYSHQKRAEDTVREELGDTEDGDIPAETIYEDSDTDWDSDAIEDPTDHDVNPGKSAEDEPKPLTYAIKHWLHHASKATPEMAESLSKETLFWREPSALRKKWFDLYIEHNKTFFSSVREDLDIGSFTSMHMATAVGFAQLVSALLRNGYSDLRDKRDSLGNAPIHVAAFFGRYNTVDTLLNAEANVNEGLDERVATPMHIAALDGDVSLMKQLLRREANIDAVFEGLGPVINAAIASGNEEAVRLLVEQGASFAEGTGEEDCESALVLAVAFLPDLSMFNYLVEQCANKIPPSEYSEALKYSAEVGRLDVFDRLLKDQDSQDVLQETLEIAVDERNWEIITKLLRQKKGLDCNATFLQVAEGDGTQEQLDVLKAMWTHMEGNVSPGAIKEDTINEALYKATDNERDGTVRFLLEECNADPNVWYGNTEYSDPLTAAAFDGTTKIIDLLLEHGARVKSSHGCALKAAAGNGHVEAVKLLLGRGADVDDSTTIGCFQSGTALQAACDGGWTKAVDVLLTNGANPNIGGGEFTLPIISAARKGEKTILQMLVEHDAQVDVFGGPDGSTPLINAVISLPCESIKVLLDNGADINLADKEGDNALIMAAHVGDAEIVQFLLEKGADIMHISSTHGSALQTAHREGNTECLQILLDHMASVMKAISEAIASGHDELARVVQSASMSPAACSHQSAEPADGDDQEVGDGMGETVGVSDGDHVDDDESATKDATDDDDGHREDTVSDVEAPLSPAHDGPKEEIETSSDDREFFE